MNINVYGLGNVGLITALCLAEDGNQVQGIEINAGKVERLNAKRLYVYEPQLENVFQNCTSTFSASTSCPTDNTADTSVVCVGTPSQSNGDTLLTQVVQTLGQILEKIKNDGKDHNIILRSTIPPGTCENTLLPLIKKTEESLNLNINFYYCPEFLREGSAVADFRNASLELAASNVDSLDLVEKLFKFKSIQNVSFTTAEMIKYLNNSFHALKVAFANEAGQLAKGFGVDQNELFKVFTSDQDLNISDKYLYPGFAFGGICLNKELAAMEYFSKKLSLNTPLLKNVKISNSEHIGRLIQMIESSGCSRLTFVGVCFKPNTNDFRYSPFSEIFNYFHKLPSYLRDNNIKVIDDTSVTDEVFREHGIHALLEKDLTDENPELVVLGSQKPSPELISYLKTFDGHIINAWRWSLPDTICAKNNYCEF